MGTLQRCSHILKHCIMSDFNKTECDDECICLVQNRVQEWVSVSMVMYFWILRRVPNFLTSSETIRYSKTPFMELDLHSPESCYPRQ